MNLNFTDINLPLKILATHIALPHLEMHLIYLSDLFHSPQTSGLAVDHVVHVVHRQGPQLPGKNAIHVEPQLSE